MLLQIHRDFVFFCFLFEATARPAACFSRSTEALMTCPEAGLQLSSNQTKKQKNLWFEFRSFSVISRPSLAPRPVPTGQARKMMQHAPKISPGDQIQRQFVASSWSRPKKLKFKMAECLQVRQSGRSAKTDKDVPCNGQVRYATGFSN